MDDTAVEDEVTEFELIEVESIKAVPMGANGFPHLIMKGVAAERQPGPAGPAGPAEPSAVDLAVKAVTRGKIDEAPDIDLGQQIMVLLGKAIANEADEIAAGSYGETCDVDLLNNAASMINCWIARESAPAQQGAWDGVVMASAALSEAVKAAMSSADQNDLPDSAFAYIEDGGKKDADGKTTPRSKRHFPVHDKAHAENALARLSSSPFGDKAKAKVHAAAKKFGIKVSDDAGKSAVAEGETAVDTDQDGTIAKAVEEAVAKATAPSEGRITQAEERAAKAEQRVDQLEKLIKSTPVPGGPVLSANARPPGAVTAGSEDLAAKAALYRAKADAATDPGDREGYRQLARETDERAAKLTA
jgi:hypothetical protein